MTKRLLLSPGTENFFLSWYLPFKGPHSPTHLSGSPTLLLIDVTQERRSVHAQRPHRSRQHLHLWGFMFNPQFTDNLMLREKRIRSSSAVSMTSTGFANMTWHGIPLTPSPVGWSSRLVEASKIHNLYQTSDKSWQNVSFSVKRKLRGVRPAGGVWLGVHRPQRSHPILYQVFINISTEDHLVGQLWKKKLHTKPKLYQEHQYGPWGE